MKGPQIKGELMIDYTYNTRLVDFYDDGIVCQNPFYTDEDYKPGGCRYGYKRDYKINWHSLVQLWEFDAIRETIEMTDDEWQQVKYGIESFKGLNYV